MMNRRITGEQLESCLSDAARRLGISDLLSLDGNFHIWPQTWPDSACGFRGVAMRAFTTASTLAVIGPKGDVCVYHDARFVRHIREPDEAFWVAFGNRKLPGAWPPDGWDEIDTSSRSEATDGD
jgi:hypothetical protein